METNIISPDAKIGERTKIWHYAQVREGAAIGTDCTISKNCYIDKDVRIGNNVKIQNNVSVYHGVTLENGVFVGPHVCFTNDLLPRAINKNGSLKLESDWKLSKTLVKEGASLGANSTIVAGVTIGTFALVGAGSVVTKDIPDYGFVYGNPARLKGYVCACAKTKVPLEEKHLACPSCGTQRDL